MWQIAIPVFFVAFFLTAAAFFLIEDRRVREIIFDRIVSITFLLLAVWLILLPALGILGQGWYIPLLFISAFLFVFSFAVFWPTVSEMREIKREMVLSREMLNSLNEDDINQGIDWKRLEKWLEKQ